MYSRLLSLAFVLCLLLGAGPGVMLVNRPDSLFGWPQLYVWAVGWCIAQVALVWAMDRFVWRSAEPHNRD